MTALDMPHWVRRHKAISRRLLAEADKVNQSTKEEDMDPNALLQQLRAEAANFFETGELYDLDIFVECVENLDRWISSGGFLPKAWQQTVNQPTKEEHNGS